MKKSAPDASEEVESPNFSFTEGPFIPLSKVVKASDLSDDQIAALTWPETPSLCLSQVELGALLGMNEKSASSRLSRYERGEREPDYETLAALSDPLGVPPAYSHASSDVLAEVILLVARLPEERQQSVLELIKSHLTAKSSAD